MNTIYNLVIEELKKEGWHHFPVTFERMRAHAEDLASRTPLNVPSICIECYLHIYNGDLNKCQKESQCHSG